jgi:CheY-like chemotaxis protein
MKKVLLLEDNGFMYDSLKELLEENNFEVKDAYQISDAIGHFNDTIDYMIVDLNVPPIGLTKEQRDQTEGGIFSGWIWLQEYVFKNHPEYRKKVIIYSAYINRLSNKYPSEIKGIKLMDKGHNNPSAVIEVFKKL